MLNILEGGSDNDQFGYDKENGNLSCFWNSDSDYVFYNDGAWDAWTAGNHYSGSNCGAEWIAMFFYNKHSHTGGRSIDWSRNYPILPIP